MDESDQLKFGIDLLDPTVLVPEELVPLTPLGKLTLNRNPMNYFAETEQIMVSVQPLPQMFPVIIFNQFAVPARAHCARSRLLGRSL
jgi:catalase